MGEKRRSNGDHDIGDSKPGTVGDKRPDRDPSDSPMDRIHKRRHGEIHVPKPSDNESNSSEEKEEDPHYQNKEHLEELSDGTLGILESL